MIKEHHSLFRAGRGEGRQGAPAGGRRTLTGGPGRWAPRTPAESASSSLFLFLTENKNQKHQQLSLLYEPGSLSPLRASRSASGDFIVSRERWCQERQHRPSSPHRNGEPLPWERRAARVRAGTAGGTSPGPPRSPGPGLSLGARALLSVHLLLAGGPGTSPWHLIELTMCCYLHADPGALSSCSQPLPPR